MEGNFVPRFQAWCDRDQVDVDFRLGRQDKKGRIQVAIRKEGQKPKFVLADKLKDDKLKKEAPLGLLAVIRQLHRRQ